MKKPWWQHEVTIAWALILFFPLGLLLMWIYAPWRKGFKWLWTAVFVIISTIVIATPSGKGDDPSAEVSEVGVATEPAVSDARSTAAYLWATAASEPETPTPNATATAQYLKPIVTPGPPLRIASYLKTLAAAAGDMQSRYVQATATQQAQEQLSRYLEGVATQQAQEQLSRYLEGVATSEAERAAEETRQAEPPQPSTTDVYYKPRAPGIRYMLNSLTGLMWETPSIAKVWTEVPWCGLWGFTTGCLSSAADATLQALEDTDRFWISDPAAGIPAMEELMIVACTNDIGVGSTHCDPVALLMVNNMQAVGIQMSEDEVYSDNKWIFCQGERSAIRLEIWDKLDNKGCLLRCGSLTVLPEGLMGCVNE